MDSSLNSRRMVIEAVAVGAVAAIALAVFRTPRELLAPGVFNDDGVYLTLGRAIATGHGYHSIHMPREPLQVKYPPGLPIVFAAFWMLFGSLAPVVTAASLLSVLVTGAAAAVIWYVARARLEISPIVAFSLAIAPLFLDSAIQYYTLPMSEAYYVLFWGVAVLLTLRICEPSNDHPMRGAMGLGLVLAAAILVRTQAVAVFGGAVIALIVARRRREAGATAIVGALPFAVWSGWLRLMQARGAIVSVLPDEGSYIGFVGKGQPLEIAGGLARTVELNAHFYIGTFATYLNDVHAVGVAICSAVIVLGALGAWWIGRERLVLPLTVAASGAMTLMWPYVQDRLLIPLLPFAGLLAALSVERLLPRLPRAAKLAGVATLLLIVGSGMYRQMELRTAGYRMALEGGSSEVNSPSHFLLRNSRAIYIESAWINKHARPEDRMLAGQPSSIFLLTGRRAESSDPAESRLMPSVYAVPGRFLAKAIREDSISLIAVELPDALARDVGVVSKACPAALRLEGRGATGLPAFVRVVDPICINAAFPPTPP